MSVHGDDEIGSLARSIDEMLARLDEAFGRQRQFVDDASHELRTPLAVIRANVDAVLDRPNVDPPTARPPSPRPGVQSSG